MKTPPTVQKMYQARAINGGYLLQEMPSGKWICHTASLKYFRKRCREFGVPYDEDDIECCVPTLPPGPLALDIVPAPALVVEEVVEAPAEPPVVPPAEPPVVPPAEPPVAKEEPSSYTKYHRRYYELHKEKKQAAILRWNKENPDKIREYRRAYRARVKARKEAAKTA